jgi:hypothetical protein
MISAAAPALDFTLGVGPTRNCASRGLEARAAVLTYLEPAPVLLADEYGGHRYDADDGNNVGVGNGYADLTAPAGPFCVGLFVRADYRGEASKDTLDALVANHADRPFDVGRNYALAFESIYLESAGVKLSRVFAFAPAADWQVRFGVTGSIAKAITYEEEWLRGRATATSGTYAIGTAALSRTRSDYNLAHFNPFIEKRDPDGYGYYADVDLVVRSPVGYVAELTVMDVWSRVDWNDVPQSLETIDNATIRYDANFNREAFIQGRDRRVDLEHVIEPRYRVAFSAPVRPGLAVVVANDYVQETHFPALGVSYSRIDQYGEASFDIQTGAISLSAGKGGFRLSLTADDLKPRDASVLGAEFRFLTSW